MKATNVAFILAFWVVGTLADPETVKGLLKKNTNSWNVPIVAKQANENNPTQVVGGYPKLELDTLARPLKSGARPFGQYLPESSSSSAIPNHLLQWLAQRQSRITTTTEKTLQGLPLGDDGSGDGNLGSLEAVVSKDQQVKKPSLRSAPVAVDTLKGLTKLGSSPKPKLIQRPAYNPELARKDGEVESDNTTKADTDEDSNVTYNPKVAAIIMDDYIARKNDKLSVAGLVIGLTFVAAFISIAVGLVGHGLIKRCRHGNDSGRSSHMSGWMRSPGDDEDRTPPELRPGSNCGGSSRRSSSGRTRHIPGNLPGHGGTPFFNGKLILHDPPGLANGARGAMRPFNPGNILGGNSTNGPGGFMITSPPSKFGAIPKKMPSPAAQVTDVLVSPKYEDGETTEEEDSDDTVYECPGLGATKGMEVRNPFFMDGRGPEIQPPSSKLANKKPISQYTDLFHHQEIVGLN